MQAEQPTPLAKALLKPGVWWALNVYNIYPSPLKLEVLPSVVGDPKSVRICDAPHAKSINSLNNDAWNWVAYRNYWFAWAAGQRKKANEEMGKGNTVHP